MDAQIRNVQPDVEEEKKTRLLLEMWKGQLLEQNENLKSGADNAVGMVDKSIAIVGGLEN